MAGEGHGGREGEGWVRGRRWDGRRGSYAAHLQSTRRRSLVGEIAPGIPSFAIPAIPGLAAVRMVRNSSRNSNFAIPGTQGVPNGGALSYSQRMQELFLPFTCLNAAPVGALPLAAPPRRVRAALACDTGASSSSHAHAMHAACRSPACSLAQVHALLKMIGLRARLVCEASR